ncbi:hypothetical protein G7Z17_g1028 [Cylindrodendrum hubeiense]|uniref:Mitochondrial division protein 1 n=1 Tax=Cylindrodendrum hubeiense TaxID=595255 RepID=A0A9P5LCU6_9HYPO|nr:hypothetical protein G7Z17_g1028 [Cylindrodendrum hubeiense]
MGDRPIPHNARKRTNVANNSDSPRNRAEKCSTIDSPDIAPAIGDRIVSHNTLGNNTTINQGDVTNIFSRELHPTATATDAAFDSYAEENKARCHPETRTKLLHQIRQWAEDPHGECIFWLNGMAGTGKSTISRTIAWSFKERGLLGASFFFKKGEGDRGHARFFFTTILSQLIYWEPTLEQHVGSAIGAELALNGKGLREQFEKLILQPLQSVHRDPDSPLKIVIVIDALDECDRDEDIKLIIHLLPQLKALGSVRMKIFITSRPELPTRLGFEDIKGKYEDVVLHQIPEPVIKHDIYMFLSHELERIRMEHNSQALIKIPSDWPSEHDLQALVHMAVPLFIFAATACRFVADPFWSHPLDQLKKVLSYRSSASDPEFDKLATIYLPILDRRIDGSTGLKKSRLLDTFQEIVGSIVLLAQPLSVLSLAMLLDTPPETIDGQLRTLHSILSIPSKPNQPIKLFHLSFRDFLVNPVERHDFWVDEMKHHERLAERCLQVINGTLKKDICNLQKPGTVRTEVDPNTINKFLPAHVRYACQYWVYHLEQSKGRVKVGQVYTFLKVHFLHWLEALSLMGKIGDGVRMISTLQMQPGWPKVDLDWNACLQTLEGHRDQVSLVAFSPDAKRVVSSDGSVIKNWDAATGDCLQTLELGGRILALSPDAKRVASKDSFDIKIWDATTGDCLQTLEGVWDDIVLLAFSPDAKQMASIIRYHGNEASVAFSPDAKQVVVASLDGTIDIWDITTGFSPDGKRLVTGGRNVTQIWDTGTGDCLQTFEGHCNAVRAVTFSAPDAKQVASASSDGTVKIWDATMSNCQQTIARHLDRIHSIIISHDKRQVASASADCAVKIWDFITGDCLQTLEGHRGEVRSAVFSSDAKWVASASKDRVVKIWDTATGRCLQSFKECHYDDKFSHPAYYPVMFSPDAKRVASLVDDLAINIWDTTTGRRLQKLAHQFDQMNLATFSPDAKLVASPSQGCTVKIWDTAMGDCLQTLKGHSDDITSVAFPANANKLASASWDGTIKIWDTITGRCLQTLKAPSGSDIYSVAFSLDSKRVAAASDDGTLGIWDAVKGDCLHILQDSYETGICSVAFSSDAKRVVSVWPGVGTIRIWDAATGDCLLAIDDFSSYGRYHSVAFSPDAMRVASVSGESPVSIWDAVTGGFLQWHQHQGSGGGVYSIAFSPDANRVASTPGRTAGFEALMGHGNWVNLVAFSPDLKRVCSASDHRTIKIWDAATGDCLQTLSIDKVLGNIFFNITGSRLPLAMDAIDLKLPSASDTVSTKVHKKASRQPYGISRDKAWITWCSENLLWLPSEFRPGRLAVVESTVVIGSDSGRVILLKFSADDPIA